MRAAGAWTPGLVMDGKVTFMAGTQAPDPWLQAELLPEVCPFSTMLGDSSGESTFLLSSPHD